MMLGCYSSDAFSLRRPVGVACPIAFNKLVEYL